MSLFQSTLQGSSHFIPTTTIWGWNYCYSIFQRRTNWDTEKLSDPLKVTQPIRLEAQIQTQAMLFRTHAPDHASFHTKAQPVFDNPNTSVLKLPDCTLGRRLLSNGPDLHPWAFIHSVMTVHLRVLFVKIPQLTTSPPSKKYESTSLLKSTIMSLF